MKPYTLRKYCARLMGSVCDHGWRRGHAHWFMWLAMQQPPLSTEEACSPDNPRNTPYCWR